MTDTPEEKYESKQHTLWGNPSTFEDDGYVHQGKVTEEDADRIQELCDAFDPEKLERKKHKEKKQDFKRDKRKDKSYSTLWGWMYRLTRIARDLKNVDQLPDNLVETDADDINDLMETGYYHGDLPKCKGMKKSTVRTYQFATRIFYRYHGDLDIDPDHIAVYSDDGDPIDPDEMLTKDEIQRLTQAADHPRDLMIFHLLLYTGMRSNAARTLRVKDINLEDGTYRFNDDVDHGLKGADERNGKRPLLLAEGAIRQWLNNYHPSRHDDDFEETYLITGKPNYGKANPRDTVGHNCLSYALRKMKEKTGVEKLLYPHMCRHNFVTICKRDYGLPDDTVKYLIGHAADSRVMETTYAHLSGDDYVERAEVGAGLREENEDKTLTPVKCICGAKSEPGARACANCGIVFSPDAKAVEQRIDNDLFESKGAAESPEEERGVDVAREIINNDPEAKSAVMEELKDELMSELKEELSGSEEAAGALGND